jgi:hypothetical protein
MYRYLDSIPRCIQLSLVCLLTDIVAPPHPPPASIDRIEGRHMSIHYNVYLPIIQLILNIIVYLGYRDDKYFIGKCLRRTYIVLERTFASFREILFSHVTDIFLRKISFKIQGLFYRENVYTPYPNFDKYVRKFAKTKKISCAKWVRLFSYRLIPHKIIIMLTDNSYTNKFLETNIMHFRFNPIGPSYKIAV